MRGNFLYLPTDCPQRDERLGWTGDIQVFAPTASLPLRRATASSPPGCATSRSSRSTPTACVPFIVPDVLRLGPSPAAAWGDAATVVPWVLYERFGDVGMLERQYASMRAWVDVLLDVAGDRRLWEGRFQFGDWLDPDAPPERPADAKTDARPRRERVPLPLDAPARPRGRRCSATTADAERYGALAERVRARVPATST